MCVHKDEEEDESGYSPSYEMSPEQTVEDEISFVCPKCLHEIYIQWELQPSEVSET